MKINREPLGSVSSETVAADQSYWQPRVDEMIGGWLHPETSVKDEMDYLAKIYSENSASQFPGNSHFLADSRAQKMFSKLRSAIASVYAWRVGALKGVPTPDAYLAKPGPDRDLMIDAADFAFRQSIALCPSAAEMISHYADFLQAVGRKDDAVLVLELGSHAASGATAEESATISAKKETQAQ